MKILITGDFCPSNRVAEAFEKEDYASVLSEVQSITVEADYSIVNLECPIVAGNASPIKKLGPNLKSNEKSVEAIKWAGFDCVTLANNHFYDFGDEGVADTLQSCKKHGIDYVGGGKSISEASQTLYKTIDGRKLAIINCCEHEFSIASETTGGSNPLNPIKQYYAIKEAKNKADYILVVVHGGHEHWQLPSPRMVETYRFFVDAGADAVVNHHQHCFSGYEYYQGRPIFYGLGNFCFDNSKQRNSFWNEGYAVMISFANAEPIISLYPYRQCDSEPLVEMLSKDVFNEKLEEINTIISNPKKLRFLVEQYYATCANSVSNIFEPLYNRFYLAAKHKGWLPSLVGNKRKTAAQDIVICEAHRDKLAYWLNMEDK